MKAEIGKVAIYTGVGALALDEINTALKAACSERPIIDDGVTITMVEGVRDAIESNPVNGGEKIIKEVADSGLTDDTYVMFYE